MSDEKRLRPKLPERFRGMKNGEILKAICVEACSGKFTPEQVEENLTPLFLSSIADAQDRPQRIDRERDREVFRVKSIQTCEQLLSMLNVSAPRPILALQFVILQERMTVVCGDYLGIQQSRQTVHHVRRSTGRCLMCGYELTPAQVQSPMGFCSGCERETDEMLMDKGGETPEVPA